jgi:agmatinase
MRPATLASVSDAPRLIAPGAGFLGAPVETDPQALTADVAIVGVAHGVAYPWSSTSAGCADAPAAIRESSQRLARFRGHWDFDADRPMLPLDNPAALIDCGDVPGSLDDPTGNSSRAEAAIRAVLASGAVPLVLGGDDSIPIPVLSAFAGRGPLTVLQIDAHLDFREEVGGIRDGYSSPMRRASEMSHVGRIVQVGLRGVGSARPSDVEDARAAGNVLITARAVRERGAASVASELRDDASVFVSFDLDGLDLSVMSAVSAPAPGGLGWDEVVDLLGAVGPRTVGAAFTEYVPQLDASGAGALVVTRLVSLLAGSLHRT